MLHGVIRQFLGDVEWGDLDYLIVDLPPGTGDVQLTLSQIIPPTGYVLVTTPQEVALLDARRAANMFAKVRVPALGVVENMAGFDCPHCAQRTDLFGAGGGRRIAEELGVPLLGSIPIDPRIMAGSDSGDPIVLQKGAPESVRRAYVEAAAQLAARISVLTLQAAGASERTAGPGVPGRTA
jgi:ATP-binding protein involved in chromosome partitioning